MGYERTSMSTIAARVSCSKPTLYGYFPSKEDLFMNVVIHKLGSQLEPAFKELPSMAEEDPHKVLTKFGETYIGSIGTPVMPAIRRLFIEVTDQPTAQRLWEMGGKIGVETIQSYLEAATCAGRLNVKNPLISAQQLLALYEAEIMWGGPFGFVHLSDAKAIRQAASRAVTVFLAAYGAAKPVDQ
jgi:AcrR family transcriptional regulator